MIKNGDELRLRQITAETLGIDDIEIDNDTGPETTPSWTSIVHLSLMSAVEEGFGVQFSMEEMTGVKSYSDLKELLSCHR